MIQKISNWLVETFAPLFVIFLIVLGFVTPVMVALYISGQNTLILYLLPMISVYFLRKVSLRDNFVNLLVVWGFSAFLLVDISKTSSLVNDVWGMWIPAATVSIIAFIDWALPA